LLKGEQLYVRTGALGAALAAGVFPVFLLGLVSVVFHAASNIIAIQKFNSKPFMNDCKSTV
jgi:hypothetical protein